MKMSGKITGTLVLIFVLVFSINVSFALGPLNPPGSLNPLGPLPILKTVESLSVWDLVNLKEGETYQLSVTAKYSDSSEEDVTSKVSYSVRTPGIASVSAAGLITAVAPGETAIDIGYGGKQTFMIVKVEYPPDQMQVTDLILTGFSSRMDPGEQQDFKVFAKFKDGTEKEVTSNCTYGAGNDKVISVSIGSINAIAQGSSDLVINYQGFSRVFQITVSSTLTGFELVDLKNQMGIHSKYPVWVRATYSDGTQKNVTSKSNFSVDNSDVELYPSQNNMDIYANAEGSAVISVEFEGQARQYSVAFTDPAAVTVTELRAVPENIALQAGQAQQVTVYAMHSNLREEVVTSKASYSMADTNIAEVTPAGRVTGRTAGDTTLTIEYEGSITSCSITVTGAPGDAQAPVASQTPAKGNFSYEAQAQALHELGLYSGVSTTGFDPDLGSALDRETGVVMLLRIFCLEKEALAMSDTDVNRILARFKDASSISNWAKKSVAYAVKNMLVVGTGNNKFEAKEPLNGNAYSTLVLKQLGYTPDYNNAPAQLADKGGLTVPQAVKYTGKNLIKDDLVAISYNVLRVKNIDGERIIDLLVRRGTVDKEVAETSGLLD